MQVSIQQRGAIATIVLSAVTMAGLPAFAGGYAEPVATVHPAPPPMMIVTPMAPMTDWTGLYLGGTLGYGDLTESPSSSSTDKVNGETYGVQAGYLYDLGTIILGAELQYVGTNISDSALGLDIDAEGRAKLRVGYDGGMFQPYAVVGASKLMTSGSISDSDMGYLYGVGLDYRYASNLLIGAELLQHQYDDFASSGIDLNATTVEVRVSYKF